MTFWRMLRFFTHRASFPQRACWGWSLLVIFLVSVTPAVRAQNLNWEGQTGAFVTPFAYTSASPARGFGLPVVSFHYLDGGNVLGGFYEISGTVGFLRRFEAGYTRALNSDGSVPSLSPLFNGGFNIFHGKVNLVGENAGKHSYIPAISLGFVAGSFSSGDLCPSPHQRRHVRRTPLLSAVPRPKTGPPGGSVQDRSSRV